MKSHHAALGTSSAPKNSIKPSSGGVDTGACDAGTGAGAFNAGAGAGAGTGVDAGGAAAVADTETAAVISNQCGLKNNCGSAGVAGTRLRGFGSNPRVEVDIVLHHLHRIARALV